MKELTSLEEVDKFIAAHTLVILEFGAPWCAPCKQLEPVLDQIQNEYQVEIGKVDVQRVAGAIDLFQVAGLPTLLLVAQHQPVNAISGARGKTTIVSTFKLVRRNGKE